MKYVISVLVGLGIAGIAVASSGYFNNRGVSVVTSNKNIWSEDNANVSVFSDPIANTTCYVLKGKTFGEAISISCVKN